MVNIDLTTEVHGRFKPFLDDVLARYEEKIHSIYITGSALTEDFDPKTSDINSVIVLKQMELEFLTILAPLGKKYGKKRVAAPLIMTAGYIRESIDVFPIEFLNIKRLHHTIWGEDIFKELMINTTDLRHQCERELKVKLIGLRQGYIASAGDRGVINQNFKNSIAAFIPLFRSIIVLMGKDPPLNNAEVLAALEQATGINTDAFKAVLKAKRGKEKLSLDKLNTLFEDYYATTERLGKLVDGIEA